MPVVTNTFSGEDANYNKTEYIGLPLTSASSTFNSSHSPSMSKIFSHAIYTTLLDAGYDVSYNEETYCINIWDFEFHALNNGQYPQIYVKGSTSSFGSTANNIYYRTSTNSQYYSFSITVRGSSDAVNIYMGGNGYETNEYSLLFLAKAIYLPTNKNGFLCLPNLYNSSNNNYYTYLEDNLYTIHNSSANYLKTFYANPGSGEVGTGKGYILVPQLTIDSVWYVKGMAESNTAILAANKYYKLNDEIYYSNENKFLYRVDI